MRRKNTTKQMMKEYISQSLMLLMEKKKYADITIGEITSKAGVNRSTYYRNFISKEEIIKFYFEQIMSSYLAKYEASKDKSFENYLNTMFEHFYLYKKQLLLIYKNELSYLILETINRIFENKQTKKYKIISEQYKLYYHIGGIYNFLMLWFAHNMKEHPQELTQISVEIFPKYAQPIILS